MALYFENVTLLTYQHSPVFFDAGLRFKVQKAFTINGVLRSSETEGVSGTWDKAQQLQLLAEDYQSILLNGVDFGKGKILSINFDSGDHVKQQKYTYQIQAYSEGNLFNAQEDEYAGIDWDGDKIHCVDRLEESFSYTDSELGDQSYEHSISVKFNRDVENLSTSPIDLAKTLAQDLMDATNLTEFLGQYASLSSFKKNYTETYNLIDFSCSFVERAEIPKEAEGEYSIARNFSLQQNENGIVTASEKGTIKGLSSLPASSAWEGYEAETEDAAVYARVTEVYDAHAFSLVPLHSTVINKSVLINKFSGEIEYSLSFTNDPRINDLAVWEYTIQLNRSAENYITASENGSVRGIGRPRQDKYQHAKEFYDNYVKPYIEDRIRAAYENFEGQHEDNLMKIKEGFSSAEYAGEITYGETWTDNNLFINDLLIRKQEIEVVTEYPVEITFVVNVINIKQLLQPVYNSTVGHRRVSIHLKGKRTTTMENYVQYSKDIINSNSYNDIGEDTFIANCQYSLNPSKNEFTFSIDFSFHGFYKAFNDLAMT